VVAIAQLGPGFDARPVFVAERLALLDLLADLDGSQWAASTICPGWTVRDIAVHLLHDDLRRVSRSRDGYDEGSPTTPTETLAASLNDANERWVRENAFLSPRLLVDLLSETSRLLEAMWAAADLDAPSEGVWWAGVELAPVWLDLARDYSEDWTHQQQIRDAVDRPGMKHARFLDPVLDTFLRAAPHTYRHVSAPPSANVRVDLEDGGRTLTWSLRAAPAGWFLERTATSSPTASITLPAETLWRLASGGIGSEVAAQTATISGARDLAEPMLHIVSVVR
jgi:uncharacterized protein (TIGR03083 family)